MNKVKCFWLEPTTTARAWLRRFPFRSDTAGRCPHPDNSGYHDAMLQIADIPDYVWDPVMGGYPDANARYKPPVSDPRWPTACACGYQFADTDHYQVFTRLIYQRTDTGETLLLDDAPPGAMYDAFWLRGVPRYSGPDGRSLYVILPDGNRWCIDGVASNCTRKDDLVHKCWIRHGEPPDLTVDKRGNTCQAGAGSILTPKFHGFLRNGFLEGC